MKYIRNIKTIDRLSMMILKVRMMITVMGRVRGSIGNESVNNLLSF